MNHNLKVYEHQTYGEDIVQFYWAVLSEVQFMPVILFKNISDKKYAVAIFRIKIKTK
jgi:hypothetical protein